MACSYMVLITVFSRPQLNAVLGKLERTAAEARGRSTFEPVRGRSAWEALDLGDVVCQIQSAEVRLDRSFCRRTSVRQDPSACLRAVAARNLVCQPRQRCQSRR